MEEKISIIFVHSGDANPPMCMVDSVAIACQVAPCSNVIVLVNHDNIEGLRSQLENRHHIQPKNLTWVSIESLCEQKLSIEFSATAKADKEFRDGFWLQTANRFMLIADLMISLDLKNCLHLENDNVLYFDPGMKLEAFQKHARFAIPFDRSRAIPGIVWFRDAQISQDLARYIQDRSDAHDFDVIRQFCDSGLFDAKPLPTMPPIYAKARNLSLKDYCDGYDVFGGIFDAAAIGQYFGGVDPRNIAGSSRFFINETSDLDLSTCGVVWGYEGVHRSPMLVMMDESIAIMSLHAHSKDVLGVSPFNRCVIEDKENVITGERFQKKADLTISSNEVTMFHGLENIETNSILEIPRKRIRKYFRTKYLNATPNEQWIEECKNSKIIFVYTHLLHYFKEYVLRHLNEPFILVSHNSDDEITLDHLEILDYYFLKKWYAQNIQINHSKLSALPIGLVNKQWGEARNAQLVDISRNYIKSGLIYSNFRIDTHPSRADLAGIIRGVSFIKKSANLDYRSYLIELAQHKFCLCPRGNGVDTHRFWEAQYLNTIPIILEVDWLAAYSNLPVLVLKKWSDLFAIDFEKKYIEISSTFHKFSALELSHYKFN